MMYISHQEDDWEVSNCGCTGRVGIWSRRLQVPNAYRRLLFAGNTGRCWLYMGEEESSEDVDQVTKLQRNSCSALPRTLFEGVFHTSQSRPSV